MSDDLDALLDSALDDFDRPAAGLSPAPVPAAAAAPTLSVTASTSISASTPSSSSTVSASASASGSVPDFSAFLDSMQDTPEGRELVSLLGPEKLRELTQALGEMALTEMKSQGSGAAAPDANGEPDMESLMRLAKTLEAAAMGMPETATAASTASITNSVSTGASTISSSSSITASLSSPASVSSSASSSSVPSFQSSINDAISMVSEGVKANPMQDDLSGIDEILNKFLSEFEGKIGDTAANANSADGASQAASGAVPSDAAMDSLIEKLMGEMLSKDFLYEPMKQIAGQYPEWLAKNAGRYSGQEMDNYKKQHALFQRVCTLFENEPNNSKAIMDCLTEIQNYGKPPEELVAALPAGLDFDGASALNRPGMGSVAPSPQEEEELKKLAEKGCPTM